jgi:hypothetical protein
LLTFLLGGAEQTRAREKGIQDLVGALRGLREQGVAVPDDALHGVTVEPPYFDDLAETVTRLLRRPRDAQRVLRYIEWWGQAQIGLGGPSVVDGLGSVYGDYTRKLVGDIARLCVSAARLGKGWAVLATSAGNGSVTGSVGSTSEEPAPPRQGGEPAQADEGQLSLGKP